MAEVITVDALDELVQLLRDDGRAVIAPVVHDGVIDHQPIESAAELPIGFTEIQDGGRYRLTESGSEERFGYATPATSWKRFLYPERTLMVQARRSTGGVVVEQPEPDAPPVAFFGIRSCDLAALGVLDRVFLDPAATDPTYAARRSDVFVVAVACGQPGGTCFCVSMDTGPVPRSGYDLSLTELIDDDRHDFVVEAGSPRGQALLDRVGHRRATEADDEATRVVHDTAAASMGRHLDATHPPAAARFADHPQWSNVAERCLGCANCTMVCPTCFCSTTEDTTDLTGAEAQRWRVWDSCFTLDFSHMHGGSIRTSTESRYRQWLLHKLVTWHDQFDVSGCVGCGRCITWCPVGIDLTAEMAALASPPPGSETEVLVT